MRRLVKCLFLILLMQVVSVIPESCNFGLPVVNATPAIKVSNDTIMDGNIKLAQFSIMGAAIDREKDIKDDNGNIVSHAEGKVDPAVSSLNLNIYGFNNIEAKAVITIKAYDNVNFEGEAISYEEHFLKNQDGERMNLSFKYDITARTKSLIIQLKYNDSLKIYKLLVV